MFRELYEIWCRVATVHPGGSENGSVVSETQRLQSLFHQASVYPSQSQILEMIHCAREREQQQREPGPAATTATPISVESRGVDHLQTEQQQQQLQQQQQQQQRNFLTFGEFCLFANELRKCYERE